MGNAPPANDAEAMDMALTGLRFLASSDPTARPASVQAEILRALEQANGIGVAAQGYFLAAFTAGQGYSQDADYSPKAWLIHQTGVTKGAARTRMSWARRTAGHPAVLLAPAGGSSVSDGTVLRLAAPPPAGLPGRRG